MVRAWSQDGCICSADAQSVENLACYFMNNLNRVRRRFILCIIVLFVFALLDLSAQRVRLFVKIFFEHSGISITQDEIALRHADDTDRLRPPLIPKNIHQVWHNWSEESMPEDWQKDRQTCIDRNLGWNYTLWTTGTSRDFIAAYYPWFLETYDGYRYPVQRTDSVRYFLLRHYGGIYIDLDNRCLQPLAPLLYYPAWTTDGGRGALSNNILASTPDHPFWRLLTDSLISYNYNYLLPYPTISYASGQWFETAIWDHYHANRSHPPLYRVMMDNRPGAAPWIYFSQERGGSWKNWDNELFLWIGDHLGVCALMGFGALVGAWWAVLHCFWHGGWRSPRVGHATLVEVKDMEGQTPDIETLE